MIKNLVSYRVEMPSAEEMSKFITDSCLYSCKPTHGQLSKLGFANHPVTRELVSEFDDGYCLTIDYWVKKIKPSLINQLLQERVESSSRTLSKAETRAVKDDIVSELINQTHPELTRIFAYYKKSTNNLFVETINQKHADVVTGLLIKTIGSLKATTLYVDTSQGLSHRIANYLNSKDTPYFTDELTLGDNITLKGADSDSVTYKNRDLLDEGTSTEISSMIFDEKMTVKEVELIANDFKFKLTDGFKLKNICFGELEHDVDEGEEWSWQVNRETALISSTVNHIISEFTVVVDDQ